jgi:hypothetical protein
VGFDPCAPYGPLVDSALRVVTWNVWGRYGADWERRQLALEDVLAVAGDGSPGYTWSNRNSIATLGLYPDRRGLVADLRY